MILGFLLPVPVPDYDLCSVLLLQLFEDLSNAAHLSSVTLTFIVEIVSSNIYTIVW